MMFPAGAGDRLEESFVVLNQPSPLNPGFPQGPGGIGGGQGGAASTFWGTHSHSSQQRFSLDARMATLARILELASEETQFDQPLCLDCTAEVRRELLAQVEELEAEITAYAALEAKLQLEAEEGNAAPMDERTFARELRNAEDELSEEEFKLKKVQAELVAAEERYAAASAASSRLSEIEGKYWHAFNAVMLFLYGAADYRDSLQQRVDAAERGISTLRRTNVLSSVFRIWMDGPFGTISGLRLGSISETPVEWWEINAAWGQAVLLLDTLARAVGVKFTKARLEPRGSYSRVHDARGAAELFGPASKIVCISFDRAQVGFLSCLKEFSEALASRGAMDEGRPFALKFPIDGERVGGYSIRYGLSRDKAWTKSLKYTLVNLKYCLKAALMVLDSRRVAGGAVAAPLPREGPGGS